MTRLAIRRPVLTFVVFAILLLLGGISLRSLPIDLFPDITLPSVSVITFYPGASSEDVEREVTEVIEEALSTLPNIDEVTSVSQENVSAVTVTFTWGTDLDAAVNDIRDRLDFIRRALPEGVERSTIFKFDISQFPILIVTAASEDPTVDIRQFVENELVDAMKRAPGVAAVQVWGGGQKRQVNVYVDRTRLEGYHIPLTQVLAALQADNLTVPVGNMEVGRFDYLVRVPGQFRTPEEIGDVPVAMRDGAVIRVRDIGRVEDGYAEPTTYVRINGKPGVIFAVYKQSGANTVRAADAAKAALRKLAEEHPTVKLQIVSDGSDFIRAAIANLSGTILRAGLLVVLVAILFLRNLAGSLIIAVTIPVSLVVAFIFLKLIGATINLVSLSSLAIAVGMVVDNAIVVLENIFHHRERGESPGEAAAFGTGEVSQAITASTLTTVAIFLPIAAITGFIGVMFRQLAFSVVLVLAASLFAAFTLSPMLASRFLQVKKPSTAVGRWMDQAFRWLEDLYTETLALALNHRLATLLLALLVFVISAGLFRFIPTEFIPETDTSQIRGSFMLPTGTRLERTDQVARQIEAFVEKEIPERRMLAIRVGPTESGFGAIMGFTEATNTGFFSLRLVPPAQRKRSTAEIAARLSQALREIPGLKFGYASISGGVSEFLFGGGKPVSLEIYGEDLRTTDSLAAWFREQMGRIPGLTGLTVSRERGRPELWIEVDRERAHRYGLTVAQVGTYLRNLVNGVTVGTYRQKGNEYDIVLRLEKRDRESPDLFEGLWVPTPRGEMVPLANLVTLQEARGPLSIQHKNEERVVYVEADVYGRPLGAVTQDLQKLIAQTPLPPGVRVQLSGAIQQQAESFRTLGQIFLLGVLLVYLVMAAQFESFRDPFIVMFAVPFALTGVSLAFFVTGMPFSMMGFVGLVMLVGIVVNNAIVLVDYINILRARGFGVREAILTGGRRRLRPVLMTTLTTIFGLLPLALSKAEGAEIWAPLGVSVIGGLLFSTLVTLILVPVLYSLAERMKREEARP